MAERRVLDVDDVRGAVDDRRKAATEVVADDPRGRLPRLERVDRDPDDVRGVHDHDLDAGARTGGERLRLALVLRVDVGQPETATPVDVVLAARAPEGGGADAAHAR